MKFSSLIFFVFYAVSVYSQSITVITPNGGEVLSYGNNFTIVWTSSGITNVTIEYSNNGGTNWQTIATDIPSSNGGTYLWNVPNSPTTQALVRVKKNSTSDSCDNFFFIKSPQFNSNYQVKILPLGNSITYDQFRAETRFAQDKISYRLTLWDSLRNNNYNFDFIGHKLGGYYQFPDPESGGIPGISSSGLYNFLNSGYDPITQTQITSGNYLDTFIPDVVLLHIGTNGVTEPGGTDTTAVKNILNLIKAKNPNIWVILALIIDFVPHEPLVTTYNNNLKKFAQTRINAGDKILLVDMQNDAGLIYGIDSIPPFNADMFDDIHPNDSGKVKMGKLWYKALQLILPNSTAAAPSFISIADTIGYVGLPYRYIPKTSGVGAPNFSFVSAPNGMTINSKTGIVNWVPTSIGNFTAELKAANSEGNSTQQINLTVLPSPPLTNNLVSYWKLNETLSPAGFSTIEDMPGINNGFSFNSPASSVGIAGNGATFSSNSFNNNQSFKVLDDTSIYFGSKSFSIEMWIKTNQSNGVFIGKYADPDNMEIRLGLDGSGRARFFARSTKAAPQTEAVVDSITFIASTVNDNIWHHVVGIVDRNNNLIKIYVDGVKREKSVNYGNQKFFSVDPLTIGSIKNTQFYNGSLDEIAIYKRVLLDSEIQDHYNKGKLFGKGYFDKFVLVKTKIYLEGPFASNGDSMSTKLRQNNYIPLTSPYPQDIRTINSIPSGVVDWILVELRSSANGGDTIGYRSALLKSDGKVVGDDGVTEQIVVDVPPGNYYTVIRHRNHLAVMSKNKITFNDYTISPGLYDFTTSINNFYGVGGAKELKTGVWGMWAGDINGDGVIKYNLADNDRALILQKIGEVDIDSTVAGYYSEDVNMDGIVKYHLNNNDASIIFTNVGGDDVNATRISQVP